MRDQLRREAVEVQEQEPIVAEELEPQERFSGTGPIPPVEEGFADPDGASELAYAEDERERELKQKVTALVDRRFGGDFKKAFEHYDTDHDGAINHDELVKLLKDAGVGNGFTRGMWASKIIERLDSSADAAVQWAEFETVFRATA